MKLNYLVCLMLFPVVLFAQKNKDHFLHPLFKDNYFKIESFLSQFPLKEYTPCKSGDFLFYIDNAICLNQSLDGIKTHLKNGLVWESHLITLLNKHIIPGTLVLDIGAHIGTLTLPMSTIVGEKGEVIGFEPQPKLFRELYHNLKINMISNVTIMRYALGDSFKPVQMNVGAHENEGGTGVGVGGDWVDMYPLDFFEFSNISLMKIDVEGFEDQVLLGAKETILRNKPVILIEIMGGQIYETASVEIKERIDHTISILESFGYRVENIQTHDYLATFKD